MRKMCYYLFLLLGACALLALAGCEGPTGPKGDPGVSGVAGCMECHAENTGIIAIGEQWASSLHATGETVNRNTPPCSGCHTNEGFIANLATPGSPGTIANPSHIHCFTCHAPHTNGDFRLRTSAPVDLMMGGVVDIGHGNLCANCHQARTPSPLIATPPDSTKITSTRWGPHHSGQTNILAGTGGYEFAGFNYPDSPHATVVTNGCPSCHMATPVGVAAGGHSMNLAYESEGSERQLTTGCNVQDCHFGAVTSFDYRGYQTEIEGLLVELHDALVAQGILNASTDLAVAGKYPEAQIGSLYNYLLVEADRSEGVHNTQYTRALLESSLQKLGVAPIAFSPSYHTSTFKRIMCSQRVGF